MLKFVQFATNPIFPPQIGLKRTVKQPGAIKNFAYVKTPIL